MNTLIEKIEYEKSEIEFIDTFEFDMSKLSTYIHNTEFFILHLHTQYKFIYIFKT